MWIPCLACLARVSYGPSVSGFQGWQGRRRDSPMRQRKLIGAPSTETDLRGGKTIILGTTHAPLKLHSSLRQACFTPVGASITVLWTALVEARLQPTFSRRESER